MNRRALLAVTALAGGAAIGGCAETTRTPAPAGQPEDPPARSNAPTVAMLVYPKMVALDLVGPMTVFRLLGWNVSLVGKDERPVTSDLFPITPTQDFDECPANVDVLFVPGGVMGTIDVMNDAETISFLADRGSRATWVTSVCTGSLALGAAGLLVGYDATSHWTVANLLPLMGARHVDDRVVVDRNRVTGGGVTAGIDFGLTLAARIDGEEAARKAQLIMEYAPAPPFQNGTPGQAGPARVAALAPQRAPIDAQARAAALSAGRRLNIPGS